jgi:hypothetical protein
MRATMQVRLDTSLAVVDPGALIHQAPIDSGAAAPAGGGAAAAAAAKLKHTAVVIFSYLKSYEQMGKAVFRFAACGLVPVPRGFRAWSCHVGISEAATDALERPGAAPRSRGL